MDDTEALMWRLEKDPHLASSFATVMLLDRPPNFAALRERMERATIAVPRLRQRVQPSPANLSAPVWVEDPDFDIDTHVRRIACPAPGTLRQVLDLASLILADPFDRTRPLWQFVVVEGMQNGGAALIQKMHHTISDGERGVELSLAYLDFDRDAPMPPPLQREHVEEPSFSPFEAAFDFVASSARFPIAVAQQVKDLLSDPASIPDATATASKTVSTLVNTLSDQPSASQLWGERSLHRTVETARAPFRTTKDTAQRLGGTLNTAFMTASAHAAANYHLVLGAPVDTLRASMAISTRTESSGNNAFSIAKLRIPANEMMIRDRWDAVAAAIESAREASKTAGLHTLAAITAALPTSLVTLLARQQSQTIDFATSNVKGSPVPVYLAGAQVLEIYPIGPTGGVAFNLTLMSYLGSLDMAINIDTAAVTEPGLLADLLVDAFNELNAL